MGLLLAKHKGQAVTRASLLNWLRETKKPINVLGLVTWAPGLKGPAPWPRITDGGLAYYGKISSKGIYTARGPVATLKKPS